MIVRVDVREFTLAVAGAMQIDEDEIGELAELVTHLLLCAAPETPPPELAACIEEAVTEHAVAVALEPMTKAGLVVVRNGRVCLPS